METPRATPAQSSRKAPSGGLRLSLAEAARFWERRRLYYNFILTAVAVGWVVATWPHFRPALTLDALLKMAVLGLLANICYCAAYLMEFAMQGASGADLGARRWVLWLVGTGLALVFENYWIADEIYPDFR